MWLIVLVALIFISIIGLYVTKFILSVAYVTLFCACNVKNIIQNKKNRESVK